MIRSGSRSLDVSLPVSAVETAVAMVVVAGVEGALFAMVPVKPLRGADLLASSRMAWAPVFGVGALAFLHVLANPTSGYLADSSRVPLLTTVALLLFFGAVPVGFLAVLHAARTASASRSRRRVRSIASGALGGRGRRTMRSWCLGQLVRPDDALRLRPPARRPRSGHQLRRMRPHPAVHRAAPVQEAGRRARGGASPSSSRSVGSRRGPGGASDRPVGRDVGDQGPAADGVRRALAMLSGAFARHRRALRENARTELRVSAKRRAGTFVLPTAQLGGCTMTVALR